MWRLLFYPFSMIYGFIVYIRNLMFDIGILPSRQFNLPVISVGNITVGGTGKTPHVEYLVRLLKAENKIAVLSRGYKRKTKGFVLATNHSSTDEIGDEPAQMKNKYPDIEVAVCEKRVTGINQLIKQKMELIILDDAFQHRYVKPGLSILLVDFNQRIDKDHLMPAGKLREPISGSRRADIIIITKTPDNLKPIDRRLILEQIRPTPYQNLYFTGIDYGSFQALLNEKNKFPDDFYSNHELYTILLVTGIAFPNPLIEYLQNFTKDIRHLKFLDHQAYGEFKLNKIFKEYQSIENERKIIITTEKDAIKMKEINISDSNNTEIFYIPIVIHFIEKEKEFNQQIIDYVRKNKRNN